MQPIRLFLVSVSFIFISSFLYAMESNNITRPLRITLTTKEAIGVSETDAFKTLFTQQELPVKKLFFTILQENKLLSCAQDLYKNIEENGYFTGNNMLRITRSIPIMEEQQKTNFVMAWQKTANMVSFNSTIFPIWEKFETLIMGDLSTSTCRMRKKNLLLHRIEDPLFIKSISHLSVVCEIIKKYDAKIENVYVNNFGNDTMVPTKVPTKSSSCIVH